MLNLQEKSDGRFQNFTKCVVGRSLLLNQALHLIPMLLLVLLVVGASLIGVLIYYYYSQRPDNRVYPII